MRGSGWLLPIVAVIAWIASIGLPIGFGVMEVLRTVDVPPAGVRLHSMTSLLATTMGWGLLVAVVSMLVGWIPGRLLARSLTQLTPRTSFLIAAILFVPICLPSYLVFYAWWQSWPVGTSFHEWVIASGAMQTARQGTLLAGLVCWSWPLVSWCVAAQTNESSIRQAELLALDGASRLRKIIEAARSDARGLFLGGFFVFLATVANTTSFDLAEVFTVANELRAMQALQAPVAELLLAAAPLMVIIFCVMTFTALILLKRNRSSIPHRTQSISAGSVVVAFALFSITAILPLALFMGNLGESAGSGTTLSTVEQFVSLYRWSVVNTILSAALSGIIGSAIAVGLAALWRDHRTPVRIIALIISVSWMTVAVLPGAVTGAIIKSAYDHGVLAMIAQHQFILNLGHLACFGFIPALLAAWLCWGETKSRRDLRLLDGVNNVRGFFVAGGPRLRAIVTAAAVITFVFAFSEIPVTAVLVPPHAIGTGPLSLTLLNDMHYQRPQTVMVACVGMILLGMAAAFAIALLWRFRLKHATSVASLAFLMFVHGCGPDDPAELVPLKPQITFGVAGTAMGQFAYPRAIAADASRDCIYVIDKQARVQRLGYDGVPQKQWKMPEKENGKPTGVSIAPDGRIFVADTHYFRVIAYDTDGNELLRFGEFGREPGQFIYTTDVAFGPDDRIYVSEYGGNDRVQVFDATGKFLFQFGSFGSEPTQLNRPQAIEFNAQKTELFIADACNHRICVYTPEGRLIRSFGRAGRGAGELTYPYGLTLLEDGTLLVAEFGNNRIQRFDGSGTPLGMYGGIGRGPGQLQYPWAVAAADDRVFVLDSGNNRVQVVRSP